MAPTTVGAAPDAEAQRVAQEMEAARVSRLFAQTSQQSPAIAAVAPSATPGIATGATPTPPVDAGSAQNMQDRKTAFLNASTDRRTVSADRLQTKASPYVVQAGTVIPAALITGIRSDLPGQITAQVTEAVYDSPTGKYLLIPQGAKLIGQYDSSVAFGQSRLLLVWTRLIMPDGTSIVLERQPGADAGGYAGLEDEVDNHWDKLLEGAVLSTLLSVGAEAGTSQNENNLVQAIRSGASNSIEPDRPADHSTPAQRPADPDHPAGVPGPRRGHARSRIGALRSETMRKLKLGPLSRRQAGQGHCRIAGGRSSGPRGLCRGARADERATRGGACQAHRADDRALHGHRSSLRESAPRRQCSVRRDDGREIRVALEQDLEERAKRRILVGVAPIGGEIESGRSVGVVNLPIHDAIVSGPGGALEHQADADPGAGQARQLIEADILMQKPLRAERIELGGDEPAASRGPSRVA